MLRHARTNLPLLLLLGISATCAIAQGAVRTVVRVRTAAGLPVPYAWVSLAGGIAATADSMGVIAFRQPVRDTVALFVRRMGFAPFEGRLARDPRDSAFSVPMQPLTPLLDTVRVTATRTTPLASRGFYDRLERTKRGAYTAEFITPEELDARGATLLSQMFEGRRAISVGYVSTARERTRTVLLGRGKCPMTILVDGMRVRGTWQDAITSEVPQSINPAGSRIPAETGGLRLALDDIVDVHAVMGIEIYPSTANAPVDLIPIGGRGACGFVAIWTGARR